MNLTLKYIKDLNGNNTPITTIVNSLIYPWLQNFMGISLLGPEGKYWIESTSRQEANQL